MVKGRRKAVKANALAVKALKPDAVKYEVSVMGYPGLVVRVWPSGEKTFLLRYRMDGVLKRVSLDSSDLAGAIAEWGQDRAKLKQGEDAGEHRKAKRRAQREVRIRERQAPTVSALIERYLAEHVRPNLKSAPEFERILKNLPTAFKNSKVKDVSRAEIKAIVANIAANGAPVMANRTAAVLSSMLSFAADAELIPINPMLGMKRPAVETSRDRVLTATEIRDLWDWHEKGSMSKEMSLAARFQLLTGARASEVLEARWDEIVGDLWEIPAARSKSGRARQVALSEPALAVLAALDHQTEYVFASRRTDGHLRLDSYGHALTAAQSVTRNTEANDDNGAPRSPTKNGRSTARQLPWRSHDLRRTTATGLAELGVSREVIALILGHVIPGVTSRYDRGERLADKRDALQMWGQRVLAIAHT